MTTLYYSSEHYVPALFFATIFGQLVVRFVNAIPSSSYTTSREVPEKMGRSGITDHQPGGDFMADPSSLRV